MLIACSVIIASCDGSRSLRLFFTVMTPCATSSRLSVIPLRNTVSTTLPICFAASPVSPKYPLTRLVAPSRSVKAPTALSPACTIFSPAPAIASAASIIFPASSFFPMLSICSPASLNASPIFPAASFTPFAMFCAESSSDFNFCSVATISLCRASYFSLLRSPLSSCAFACRSASFSLSIRLSVSWMAF